MPLARDLAKERSGKRSPLRIAVSCWAVVAVAGVIAFTGPRFHVPRIDAGFNPSSIVVKPGHELIQSFRVPADRLDEITFDVADASPGSTLDVEIARWQGAVIRTLHRETVSLSAGTRQLSLKLAPVPTDPDVKYLLRIRHQGPNPAAHVTLRTTEGHTYLEGRLWLDGVELPLDLVMQGHALTEQPWRAVTGILRAKTGVPGLEWLFAVGYLGAVLLILRRLAQA